MATKSKTGAGSKRTKVKDLPKAAKELSGKSMKKIKGGSDPKSSVRKAGDKPIE